MLNLDDRLRAIARDMIVDKVPIDDAKRAFERNYLSAALKVADGNITRAAQILGVHRNTVANQRRRERC